VLTSSNHMVKNFKAATAAIPIVAFMGDPVAGQLRATGRGIMVAPSESAREDNSIRAVSRGSTPRFATLHSACYGAAIFLGTAWKEYRKPNRSYCRCWGALHFYAS